MAPDLIAGRYRVERELGRGGMGTVWLCRDESLGREVAVKQMARLADEPAPARERALREARAAAAFNHRNVVSVFDVVDDEDSPFLVMEYVPSRTLADVLADEGPLTPQRAARIGAQVAEGLAAAHAHGIIHRDVKPGNVLVTDDDLAKVSDFGIARHATDDRLTTTGLVRGSPPYFSPELARGGDPSPASDVWALGVTLYLLVEGEHPFPPQGNPLALLQTIVSEPPPRPRHAGPLTDPIGRMLDRDPASRWGMADAAYALRRLAGPAQPDDWEDDPTATTPVVPPAGAAAAGGVPGGGAAAPAAGHEPPPGDDSRPDGKPVPGARSRRETPGPLAALVAVLVLLAVAGAGYAMLTSGDEPSAAPDRARSQQPGAGPHRDEDSPSASPSPTSADSEESATPSGSTGSPSAPTGSQKGGGAQPGGMVGFVQSYYGPTMPDDLDAGWSMLSGRMREEVGRGSFDSFWDDIDEVDSSATSPQGADSVLTTITYRYDDGRVVRERQRVDLVREGGEWRIDDDTVLSSRTVSG